MALQVWPVGGCRNEGGSVSRPAVTLIIRGLKCDAVGCDFMDPDAAPDETSLDRPCPKCGANLLTEADLANVRLLQFVTHATNVEMGPQPDGGQWVVLRAHMDGSGDMTLTEEAADGK